MCTESNLAGWWNYKIAIFIGASHCDAVVDFLLVNLASSPVPVDQLCAYLKDQCSPYWSASQNTSAIGVSPVAYRSPPTSDIEAGHYLSAYLRQQRPHEQASLNNCVRFVVHSLSLPQHSLERCAHVAIRLKWMFIEGVRNVLVCKIYTTKQKK